MLFWVEGSGVEIAESPLYPHTFYDGLYHPDAGYTVQSTPAMTTYRHYSTSSEATADYPALPAGYEYHAGEGRKSVLARTMNSRSDGLLRFYHEGGMFNQQIFATLLPYIGQTGAPPAGYFDGHGESYLFGPVDPPTNARKSYRRWSQAPGTVGGQSVYNGLLGSVMGESAIYEPDSTSLIVDGLSPYVLQPYAWNTVAIDINDVYPEDIRLAFQPFVDPWVYLYLDQLPLAFGREYPFPMDYYTWPYPFPAGDYWMRVSFEIYIYQWMPVYGPDGGTWPPEDPPEETIGESTYITRAHPDYLYRAYEVDPNVVVERETRMDAEAWSSVITPFAGQQPCVAQDVTGTPYVLYTDGTNIYRKNVITGEVGGGSASTLYGWGANGSGYVGDGTTTERHVPTAIELDSVTQVSAGYNHAVALKSDGTVWAWGVNAYGQLGDDSTTNRNAPVQVSGLTDVTAVSAGGFVPDGFSLALKSDGTVWAWGRNNQGQLGDGSTTDRHVPVQVSTITGITAIAAGGFHSLALKSDGTVWAWGDNYEGQLGDNTYTDRNAPVQVSTITGVASIGAGTWHSLAVKTDGTAWAWGHNLYGALGDGTTTGRKVPTAVSTITDVASMDGGQFYTLAVKTDGTAWAWGQNSNGQLGDNSTTNRSAPVQVSGLTSVASISAGYYLSLAAKTDGTVWAWSYNANGQLCDGTTNESTVPIQISQIDGGLWLSAGQAFGFAGKGVVMLGKRPFERWAPGYIFRVLTYWRVTGAGPNGVSYFMRYDASGAVMTAETALVSDIPEQAVSVDWQANGTLTALYSDGTNIHTLTSTDNGATWV